MTSIDQLDDTHALRQLIRELSQFNPAVKVPAIHRTILLKEKAPRRQLLQALKDQRADVHVAAAKAIEALKPWITDEQWLEALQESTDQVYQVAIDVLRALGKDAPSKPLFSGLVLQSRWLRFRVQDILRIKIAHWSPEKRDQFIQFCTERLQQGSTENRVIALNMLGLMDDRVPIEAFLPALNDGEIKVRLAVLELFRARGQQGSELPIEPIAALLRDPDPQVRIGSICALGTQHERAPIHLFLAAMRDPSERVIRETTFILGRRRNIQAIPALVEHLLTDSHPNGFCMDYNDSALGAIDELYEHVPLELLLNALTSETENRRSRAITLLGSLKERTPVKPLLRLLDDKEPAIRRTAVFALSRHLTRILVNKVKSEQVLR